MWWHRKSRVFTLQGNWSLSDMQRYEICSKKEKEIKINDVKRAEKLFVDIQKSVKYLKEYEKMMLGE